MTMFKTATWRKSTRSQNGGACVEVAHQGSHIGVRDSKDADGPILVFTLTEFAAFIDGVNRGEFNDMI